MLSRMLKLALPWVLVVSTTLAGTIQRGDPCTLDSTLAGDGRPCCCASWAPAHRGECCREPAESVSCRCTPESDPAPALPSGQSPWQPQTTAGQVLDPLVDLFFDSGQIKAAPHEGHGLFSYLPASRRQAVLSCWRT